MGNIRKISKFMPNIMGIEALIKDVLPTKVHKIPSNLQIVGNIREILKFLPTLWGKKSKKFQLLPNLRKKTKSTLRIFHYGGESNK